MLPEREILDALKLRPWEQLSRWKRALMRRAVVELLSSPEWCAETSRGALVVNLLEKFCAADAAALVAVRNQAIRQRFDGANNAELAKAFGLHPRQIRRIVHPRRRKSGSSATVSAS